MAKSLFDGTAIKIGSKIPIRHGNHDENTEDVQSLGPHCMYVSL